MTVIEVRQWQGNGDAVAKIDISLPGDEILQKYLARRIHREVEFAVTGTDGATIVGYITGFDSRCLQMSTSPEHAADEPHSVLVFWPVARIAETGRRLDDLDHEHRSRIRSYSYALRSQCGAALLPRHQTPPA